MGEWNAWAGKVSSGMVHFGAPLAGGPGSASRGPRPAPVRSRATRSSRPTTSTPPGSIPALRTTPHVLQLIERHGRAEIPGLHPQGMRRAKAGGGLAFTGAGLLAHPTAHRRRAGPRPDPGSPVPSRLHSHRQRGAGHGDERDDAGRRSAAGDQVRVDRGDRADDLAAQFDLMTAVDWAGHTATAGRPSGSAADAAGS